MPACTVWGLRRRPRCRLAAAAPQAAHRRPLRVSASKTDPAGPYGSYTKLILDESKIPTKWSVGAACIFLHKCCC